MTPVAPPFTEDSDDSDSIGTSAASDHMLDNEGEITLDFDTTTCMKKVGKC